MINKNLAFKITEEIIEDILKGNKAHNQDYYHCVNDCGTAHCIAGWFVHTLANKLKVAPVYTDREFSWKGTDSTVSLENTEEIYQAILGAIEDKTKQDQVKEEYTQNVGFYNFEYAIAKSLMELDFVQASDLFEEGITIYEIALNFKQIKKEHKIA